MKLAYKCTRKRDRYEFHAESFEVDANDEFMEFFAWVQDNWLGELGEDWDYDVCHDSRVHYHVEDDELEPLDVPLPIWRYTIWTSSKENAATFKLTYGVKP
ncbi:hypothetical protein WG922_07755 [Ramlibacter sp. AN1015]|uniref:hypothetical protein n=1 Tax=Ramlibacter sp. AN1015 TaxID=3133428 RepID=UPI0030C1D0EE